NRVIEEAAAQAERGLNACKLEIALYGDLAANLGACLRARSDARGGAAAGFGVAVRPLQKVAPAQCRRQRPAVSDRDQLADCKFRREPPAGISALGLDPARFR